MTGSECFFVNQNTDDSLQREYQGDNSPQINLNRNEALHYVGKGSRYKLQSSCYKLFDNRMIKENGVRFDEEIHYGEDGLFTFQYLCYSDGICYSALPLWNILDRAGSATKTPYTHKWLGGIKAVDIMMQQDGLDEETMKVLLSFKAMRALVIEMHAIRSEAPLADIKYARAVLDKNKMYAMRSTKRWRLRLQIIALTKLPIWILRILL